VVAEGQTPLSGAEVLIAPDDSGMAEAGYAPTVFPAINRVPSTYLAPEFGTVLRSIFFPSRWEDGVRYLLFRTMSSTAEPEPVTVGLVGELANRVVPNTGPFGLYDKVGAGNGRGQFNQPRGIAVSPDGEQIYVVDMGNARVEHFDAEGTFIDSWGGDGSDLDFAKTDSGLGPTGIAVGDDGLIYVCDTWNHRIVVLDDTGRVVREFGAFADTADATDASPEQGSFFGPRAVTVYNNEIYVVDTGNERVQVFGLDGTFIRAFGGYGTAPSQFIEPVGIAIDSEGHVYVADSGNARISVFSTSGAPLAQWPVDAWNGNQYFEPYLAFDDQGLLYVSSSATSSVEVFDPNGTLVLAIHQVGTDQLEQPVGMAWSPEGSLLITDKSRNAVFRFTPDEGMRAAIEQETGELVQAGTPGASPQAATPIATPDDKALSVDSASSNASPEASPTGSPQASPVGGAASSPSPTPSPTPIGNG
jgi:DNA-binding beta-propeller fold protein YncE